MISNFKKQITPSPEFKENAKRKFLAEFDLRHGTSADISAAPRGVVGVFKWGLVTVLVLLGVTAGASVYAEGTNVPADNFFYPLKRLNETVQLAVTPLAEKPQLQATFAVQRVNEITDLESRKPSSTIIAKLNVAADNDVDASINAVAGVTATTTDAQGDFCARFLSSVAGAGSIAHTSLLDHPNVIKRFEDQCRIVRGFTPAVTVSTTVHAVGSATVTATSTIPSRPVTPVPININAGVNVTGGR